MAMRWIVVMILAVAFMTTACGKKRRGADTSAESADGVVQADTANIDSNGGDALPAIDEKQSSNGDPTVTADANSLPTDASAPSDGTHKKKRRHKKGAASADAADAGMPVADNSPPPAQGTGQMANYTVQKGDTLMKIAFNVYGDISQWKTIFELNKDVLQSANALNSGVALKYDKPATEPTIEKNGDPYMIKKGDTLGTIADDIYAKKNKWKKLWENNRTLIRDPNKIYAGFYLYYQITEEEKQEAERIKAQRGGTPLGGTPAAPAPTGEPVTSLKVGKDALKGGGLNNLAEPTRAPANTKKN